MPVKGETPLQDKIAAEVERAGDLGISLVEVTRRLGLKRPTVAVAVNTMTAAGRLRMELQRGAGGNSVTAVLLPMRAVDRAKRKREQEKGVAHVAI